MLTQSPFDILAETYDADFTQSEIGKLQRKRVWHLLNKTLQLFDHPLKILEINCGTGEDALQLAAMGHTVIATDASEAMIAKAQQKLFASGANTNYIHFMQCSFDELQQNFKNEKFDLVFSNFGGLNCISENEVKQLSSTLSSIVHSNGYLFLNVMSNCCLWEILFYVLKGKFKTAFRRQNKSVPFDVNGSSMPVFYYSPRSIKKLFQSTFKPIQTYPAGLFIPPSYLEKQFVKRKHWLSRLNKWEEKFGNSLLSSFADHFCIIMERKF
jgi:SAM-dependent methyltransferase